MKPISRQLDIYSEICPVSSATVIGAGLIAMTMGSITTGAAFVIAGFGVGLLGPASKTFRKYLVNFKHKKWEL